jgi:hypothetical protein
LTKHHEYAADCCLNQEPIGNNDLARCAHVDPSTASAFFTKQFKGHSRYRAMCRDGSTLATALKLLNDEFSPHHLYGRSPLGERERED